ncbi:MAG: ABC transporter permease [Chloroflexia bacterium]|nr:ABC transporter permease [Chloroflexia bacterium]
MRLAQAHSTAARADAGGVAAERTRGYWLNTLAGLIHHPTGAIGVGLIALVVFGAIAAPLITPMGPLEQARGDELAGPSWSHPLGTDEFGRDILSRVLYGARISLGVGVVALLGGAAMGVTLGVIGGFRGGLIDTLMMRLLDVLLAFPPILLGIAVTAVLEPSARSVGVAVMIASIPDFARIARSATLRERSLDYVVAAAALGVPARQIMARHLLPNVMPPLLVQLSVAMSFAILLEAGLSFLGVGVQAPQPSWGSMLQTARTYLYQAPSYAVCAGVALTLLLVGFNFVADALRDILDPRLHRQLR